jgi:hypothetical protein
MGKAASTLSERFFYSEQTSSALEGRSIYNDEAVLMGNENIFGVGLNNYSPFSLNSYATRVGKEAGALAHNMWYLTFGETGWPGLIAFAFYWICFYTLFFRCCLREAWQKDNLTYTILTGVFSAMLILQLQDLYHFSYRYTSVLYLCNIFMAIVVRIHMTQIRYKKHRHG